MSRNTTEPSLHEACETTSCFVSTSRRQFLRDSFAKAAGAMIALGMNSTAAFAMPLEFTDAVRGDDGVVHYDIPTADGAQIDKKNAVILVRWQGAVYAFNLSCPHQNTALRWDDRDQAFQCPKHHSRFQADGSYVAGSGRATRNMDRFAIVRQANSVTVNLNKLYSEADDAANWKTALVKLA